MARKIIVGDQPFGPLSLGPCMVAINKATTSRKIGVVFSMSEVDGSVFVASAVNRDWDVLGGPKAANPWAALCALVEQEFTDARIRVE